MSLSTLSRTDVSLIDHCTRSSGSAGDKTPVESHTGQAGRTTPRWDALCLVVGLIGIWLLARPYQGIRHDNTLYALQALQAIAPDSFQREIFVQYGAQDRYTVFTPFYATVIEYLGLHRGTMVLLIGGQLLWALAAALLLRRLLTGRWLWTALVVLFVSAGAYGSHRVFHIAEPFVTPRLFAESLSLLALYVLLRERLPLTLLPIAGAGLLHPIMALATAAVAFVYLGLKNVRWLWIGAAGVIVALGLGYLQIQPFVRLFQVMAPSWRHMVEWRNYSLFVSKYGLSDWSYLLHTSFIVLLSVTLSKGRARRLLLASLIAAWAALAISVVGGDWLSNVFILQIQPWRTLWLLHVLYALAVALLLRWSWPWRDVRVMVCILLTLAWLTRNWGEVGIPLSCLLLVTVLTIHTLKIKTLSWQLRGLAWLLLGLSVSIVIGVAAWLTTAYEPYSEPWRMALRSLAVTLLLPPLLVAWTLYHQAAHRPVLRCLSRAGFVVLCLIASLGWNQQSNWDRYVEQSTAADDFFRHLTPPNATVVWIGQTKSVWLGMRRASYLSQRQGAGLVFSAQFAAIHRQRLRVVSSLLRSQPLANPTWDSEAWQIDQEQFQHTYRDVCRQSTGLDYIVAPIQVPGEAIGHWHPSVFRRDKGNGEHGPHRQLLNADFYLYACARYRAPGQDLIVQPLRADAMPQWIEGNQLYRSGPGE